jgi:hypothetical protein
MHLKIDLPVVYEDSIVDAQVLIQQTFTSKKIIKSTLVRQEIEMLLAESSPDIAVINVRVDSEATIVVNHARSQTLKIPLNRWALHIPQERPTLGLPYQLNSWTTSSR